MSNDNVLTPEIIEEIPLEKAIENTLVKNNVTDKVINALKKQYGGMKLKGLDDKQGYLEIKDARNNVRKVGILTEKLCKVGREDAIKIQKLWLAKEKEVLSKIDEVQSPLDAEIKKFEDEKDRLDQLELQRKEEQFMKRQTTLLKMEAVYSGNSFTLGGVSYELENIKEADEEIWTDTILPKYQREFAKVEAERAEQERLKKEAEEKLKSEQAELLRQQAELNKQREEMALQQQELQKQKDEANRKVQEEKNKVRDKRNLELRPYIVFIRDYDGLLNMEEGSYQKELSEIKVGAEQQWEADKKEQERKIEEEKQQAIQDALKKEQQRLEEEKRLAEIRESEAEQRRQEEAAKASDKEKWQNVLTSINTFQIPEFKSGIYKGKLASLKRLLQQINEL